jgi:hypothetical protein
MPEENKIGISTGVKLGIGDCIGILIVLVVVFFGLMFLGVGTSMFNRLVGPIAETPKPAVTSQPGVPTVSQLVEEANTVDQRVKLTEANWRARLAGHNAASKTLTQGVTSSLEGPDQTIILYQGAVCGKDFADAFLKTFLDSPEMVNRLLELGFTHIVITNGASTTIREIKSGITRDYNQGFSVQRR